MKKELIKLYEEYTEAVDEWVENKGLWSHRKPLLGSFPAFMGWLQSGFIDETYV